MGGTLRTRTSYSIIYDMNDPKIRTGDRHAGHVAVLFIPGEDGVLKPQAAQDLDLPFLGWMTTSDAMAEVMTRAEFEQRCPELTAR
ncbi:MAG: hypothetical protein JWO56_738 [Acidobacteria bacterium]|nr:hypothetical protein [Acidobacteriota bacterium]